MVGRSYAKKDPRCEEKIEIVKLAFEVCEDFLYKWLNVLRDKLESTACRITIGIIDEK